MIYRLEIENFYSIRERQVIDLRAAANAPDEPGRLASLWSGSTEKAPKVVALFGANASGKSNVLKALTFIVWFVKDSFSAQRGLRMPFDRFADAEALQAPTRLGVQLTGLEDFRQVGMAGARICRYAYEFEIGGSRSPVVTHEALYYWPSKATRKVKLFERGPTGQVNAAKAFGLAGFAPVLDKILRPDASVLSTLAQIEHPFAKFIWQAASTITYNIFVDRGELNDDSATRHYNGNPALLEALNSDISRIDLGIRNIEILPGERGPTAVFLHEGLANPLPMALESQGTRQIVRVYPFIRYALDAGSIAIIDELDSAIHPLILPEILGWFHDPVRNPHNAQLWMSCQAASLLEDLIKEEVLFCEKDKLGRTKVYALRDIQAVRRTDNYYRKYLGGVFGAVPQIG